MSKHTKGPWEVFPKESKTKVYCDDTLGSLVADCHTSQQFCVLPKEEREANARLIAAAPEMYAMLKGVVDGNTLDPAIVEELLNKITPIK